MLPVGGIQFVCLSVSDSKTKQTTVTKIETMCYPSTSPSYVSLSQQLPHGVTCVQQCKAISSSRTVGQSDMDKEVSPIPIRLFGTHFH